MAQTTKRPTAAIRTTKADASKNATASASAEAEAERLEQDARRERNWKRWGPYLSERQWGTVREDYSEYGTA